MLTEDRVVAVGQATTQRNATLARGWVVGVLVAALAAIALALVATNGGPASASSLAGGQDAVPCAPGKPCTLVNGYADPRASGESPELVTFAEAAAAARPASACGPAARGYAAAGIEVDGFIGPCPAPRGVEQANLAAAAAHAAGFELGGSR